MTTITHEATLLETAKTAAQAKAAKVQAENAWRTVEDDTLAVFIAHGAKTVIVPEADGTFTRVTAEGLEEMSRSIDMDAAFALLSDEQIKAVATLAISLSALDAAVTTGVIPAALAEQIIKTKKTKASIRVTFNAKNEEVK